MAYTPVPTVATGELWTAANHNTYIKDNFAAGVPDIFTTKGDLPVASAADVAGRLPVGSNNQVLVADSAQSLGVKWATMTHGMIASKAHKFLVRPGAGANVATQYQTDGGWIMPDGVVSAFYGSFYIPDDVDTKVSPMVTIYPIVFSPAGNIYRGGDYKYGALYEAPNTHTDTLTAAAETIANAAKVQDLDSTDLSAVAGGDYLQLYFYRDGSSVADTIGATAYFLGWLVNWYEA